MGFPSNHAQNIWFFTTFLILYNIYILKSDHYLVGSILILFSIMVSISRLGISPLLGPRCHTPLQVVVGGLLGCISAILYFGLIRKWNTNMR